MLSSFPRTSRRCLSPVPAVDPLRFHITEASLIYSGFVGAQLAQLLLDLFPKVKLIATDIVEPTRLDDRMKVIKADLGDVNQVKALFDGEKIGGIFALQ